MFDVENANCFDEMLLKFWDRRGAKVCKSDRSRQILIPTTIFLQNRRRYSRERASKCSFNFQVMGFNFHRAAPPVQRISSRPSEYEVIDASLCIRPVLQRTRDRRFFFQGFIIIVIYFLFGMEDSQVRASV